MDVRVRLGLELARVDIRVRVRLGLELARVDIRVRVRLGLELARVDIRVRVGAVYRIIQRATQFSIDINSQNTHSCICTS